jgi:hypothetical protein
MSIEFFGQASRSVDGKSWVASQNYHDLISDNKVPDHHALHKFGHNANVGTTEEVVWTDGNGYTYLSAAETLQVSSDSTLDTSDGTGARTVLLEGLDTNWEEVSDTITMNGTASVESAVSFLRVFRAKVVTAGTGETNADVINIKDNADTVLMAEIVAGRGQTEMAMWTVPASHTFFLTQVNIAEGNNKKCHVPLYTRDNAISDAAWQLKNENVVNLNDISVPFSLPLKITEKTDIEFRASASSVGGDVNINFQGYYES